MPSKRSLSRAALLASISVLPVFLATPSFAQETAVDELIITATRRDSTVQDAPINIAAVGGAAIEAQGFADLADIASYVPGIHLIDQGGRDGNRIVVRGLNADPLGSSEGVGNGTGGMVATYIGEVPIALDLKLKDLDRVEFLLGPQGTLYGAGTMAGAVRYIPKRPSFSAKTLDLRGSLYGYSESNSPSGDLGITLNVPITDTFAFRGSIDYLNDSGFIDYVAVVREPGVGNPNAFGSPDLTRKNDANTEETISGRMALRWAPNDIFDANLTWYFQQQEVGARQISSRRVDTLPINVGEYESALRVLEPNSRDNNLFALEMSADLGFATLTSASAYSIYKENGQRDQTDLLIGLEYGYEGFPSFTAFTSERSKEESINQEIRLVSKGDGPFSWIVGGFYNKFKSDGSSKEFTPGLPDYWGIDRPDALEYYSVGRTELVETAFFGELSYRVTPAWQVTLGARRYSYELDTADAVDFPLYNTGDGYYGPDGIELNFENGGQKDDGWLFKFNTSYDLSDDMMLYATVSEGYRIGNSNGVGPCPAVIDPLVPIACGLPNEMAYFPDKTLNYEFGIHSQWLDKRLTLNGAWFYIEWKDPQVAAATFNGLIPITKNGEAAETIGMEFDLAYKITDRFTIRSNYSYARAELTETTINLVPTINPPGFQSTITYENGEAGDRLPGAPEHEFSFYADYSLPLPNGLSVDFSYGLAAISEIETRMGGRGSGITLDGFAIQNVSATLNGDDWTATLFVNNLFDEYAETAARNTPLYNQVVADDNGDPVYARSFYTSVLPPRAIGVRFTRKFGG